MGRSDIQGTIRRVLVTVFLLAEVIGVGGFYLLLRHQGLVSAEQQSRVLLTSATGVRDYTSKQILPIFEAMPKDAFHEVTVPSFAAQTVFRTVSNGDAAYSYRESALNPTNPADRATPFEVELARRFQQQPRAQEFTGLTQVGSETAFYLARPFRITDHDCLTCHSTPQAAPAAMLARYGSSNGFNWRMGQVIGVQLLTVPVTSQFRGTIQLVAALSGGLLLIFVIAYFALTRTLDAMLVAPMRALAAAAGSASRSASTPVDLPKGGVREIGDIAAAVERLRISLDKALARLADREGGR